MQPGRRLPFQRRPAGWGGGFWEGYADIGPGRRGPPRPRLGWTGYSSVDLDGPNQGATARAFRPCRGKLGLGASRLRLLQATLFPSRKGAGRRIPVPDFRFPLGGSEINWHLRRGVLPEGPSTRRPRLLIYNICLVPTRMRDGTPGGPATDQGPGHRRGGAGDLRVVGNNAWEGGRSDGDGSCSGGYIGQTRGGSHALDRGHLTRFRFGEVKGPTLSDLSHDLSLLQGCIPQTRCSSSKNCKWLHASWATLPGDSRTRNKP